MTLEIFLTLLMTVSVVTSLSVEALKNWMEERGKTYHANALAGYVAVVLSLLVWAGYVILTGVVINERLGVCLMALVLLSWLSAMVGYDKVVQMITQIRTGGTV